MNRNDIISELYLSKDFNDCVNKVDPEYLRDDLKAEVILVLLELDEDKIFDMHQTGKLKFYTVRIVLNMAFSNTSPFFKKFRFSNIEYDPTIIDSEVDYLLHDDEEHNERLLRELREDAAIEGIQGLYWYDKIIVELYMRLGTYRAIQAETGIKWEAAYKTVQKAVKQLRCNTVPVESVVPTKTTI